MSKNNWYKKEAAAFGTDPFGSGELTDRVRTSPFGAAGNDGHSGILEPSSGKHHPNDYFSEGDHTQTLEQRLQEEKKKKKKKNKNKLVEPPLDSIQRLTEEGQQWYNTSKSNSLNIRTAQLAFNLNNHINSEK